MVQQKINEKQIKSKRKMFEFFKIANKCKKECQFSVQEKINENK